MPAEEKAISIARGALLCVADPVLAERFTRELKLCARVGSRSEEHTSELQSPLIK
jgi:hypothetical protein